MKYDNVKEHYKNHSSGLWADRVDKKLLYPQQLMFTRNNRIFDYLRTDKDIASKWVLDFGAGYGDVSLKISPIVQRVTAADIIPYAEQMIASVKSTNIDFKNLQEQNVPFADSMFDYIILADVFEHFHPEDRKFYLDHFYRILKPGGEILIVTPSKYAIGFYEYIDTLLLAFIGRPQIPIMNHPLNFFVTKHELIETVKSSNFTFKSFTRICFYPAPERLGFLYLIEKMFMKARAHKLFMFIAKPLFRLLSTVKILNQKMFFIAKKQ